MCALCGRAAHDAVYQGGLNLTSTCVRKARVSHFYDQALKLNGERKAAEWDRLRVRARALRTEGLTYVAIGQRLGISEAKAQRLVKTDSKWMEPRQ